MRSPDSSSIDVLIKHVTGTEVSTNIFFFQSHTKDVCYDLGGKNYYYYYFFFVGWLLSLLLNFVQNFYTKEPNRTFSYTWCIPTTGSNELMNFSNESFSWSAFNFSLN